MKKYIIKILPEAIQDVIYIRNAIIKKYNDVVNADVVVSGVFDKIATLDSFPNRTPPALKISGKELYFLRAGKYTVVYSMEGEKLIKIFGVFHSKRNIYNIVKKRKVQ